MANFEVQVQWPDGTAAAGRRVVVETESGFLEEVYTNERGVAWLQSSGHCYEATLYVDGVRAPRAIRPGFSTFTLSW